jgi:hypothetical protein
MFILFGTHNFQKRIGNSVAMNCTRCNNANAFLIVRDATWFTLFFIPIFPFYFRYSIMCPICGYGSKISKEQAYNEAAKASTVYSQAYAPAQMQEEVCKGCNQPFGLGDDVVVCPTCGLRCHRKCYTGACFNGCKRTK